MLSIPCCPERVSESSRATLGSLAGGNRTGKSFCPLIFLISLAIFSGIVGGSHLYAYASISEDSHGGAESGDGGSGGDDADSHGGAESGDGGSGGDSGDSKNQATSQVNDCGNGLIVDEKTDCPNSSDGNSGKDKNDNDNNDNSNDNNDGDDNKSNDNNDKLKSILSEPFTVWEDDKQITLNKDGTIEIKEKAQTTKFSFGGPSFPIKLDNINFTIPSFCFSNFSEDMAELKQFCLTPPPAIDNEILVTSQPMSPNELQNLNDPYVQEFKKMFCTPPKEKGVTTPSDPQTVPQCEPDAYIAFTGDES